MNALDFRKRAIMSVINNNEIIKKEYITDGLIFRLDALENTSSGHSNEVSTWYDWVSKTNKTIRNYGYEVDGVSQIYWEDDALYCKANGSGKSVNLATGLKDGQSKTIDWCGSTEKGIGYTINSSFGNGGVITYPIVMYAPNLNNMGKYGVRVYYKDYSDTAKMVTHYIDCGIDLRYTRHHHCITINMDENNVATIQIYMDGTLQGVLTITDCSINTHSFRSDACLGVGYENGPITRYCTYRMYDRVLSDEEIKNNYELDKKRYLGG